MKSYSGIFKGTDRLELRFGIVRTSDHAPNVDLVQLCNKLTTAETVQAVFQRNPKLDRGHRRLGTSGTSGHDHLNPKSWSGKMEVSRVEWMKHWYYGQEKADNIMLKYSIEAVDWEA